MKIKCPVCSSNEAELEEHYRVVECKSCGMKVSYTDYLDRRSLQEIGGSHQTSQ